MINFFLESDQWLSEKLYKKYNFRLIFLIIEWSMHGFLWLTMSTTFIILSIYKKWDKSIQIKFIILLYGIIIDLIFVGLIKIIVRRNRPYYNRKDQIYEAPIADKYSFPSGHSSRSGMLFILASNLCNFNDKLLFCFLIILFPISSALSRVLMGRHYVSDVIAGLILGILEGFIAINMSDVYYYYIINFLTDLLN